MGTKMGTQMRTQGKILIKTLTVNPLAQGRVQRQTRLAGEPGIMTWSCTALVSPFKLVLMVSPTEHNLVHAAPIFSPAACPPSPSPSHILPPSHTTAPDPTTAMAITPTLAPTITRAETTTTNALANAATLSTPTAAVSPTMGLATSSEPPPNTNAEVPTSSFTIEPQQTPQVDPGSMFGGPSGGSSVIGTRRQRIRKALDLQLNACTCGVTITDLEIQEGQGVMKCHTPGCETVWVCISRSLLHSRFC